jgi:hypothetical protein
MIIEITSQVLIFKTNVTTQDDVRRLATLLNREPAIVQWTIDQHDIDHVLRVISFQLTPVNVIRLVAGAGFLCEELPD